MCHRSEFNTLRPRQNEQHFADDIFKRIFFNENVWISIKISLKFVPKGPINNIPALVQIMAWRRSGDKPLSDPMMVSLPTHIIYASLGLNELTISCYHFKNIWWSDISYQHSSNGELIISVVHMGTMYCCCCSFLFLIALVLTATIPSITVCATILLIEKSLCSVNGVLLILVQIMAWHRWDGKPLFETIMIILCNG